MGPQSHNPVDAAKSIVAVAEAAAKLTGEVRMLPFSARCSPSIKRWWSVACAQGVSDAVPPQSPERPSLVVKALASIARGAGLADASRSALGSALIARLRSR